MSAWSSYVCSSDRVFLAQRLAPRADAPGEHRVVEKGPRLVQHQQGRRAIETLFEPVEQVGQHRQCRAARVQQLLHLECLHVALAQGLALGIEQAAVRPVQDIRRQRLPQRSEEHTSELQSLMRSSYAVFCLKNKRKITP